MTDHRELDTASRVRFPDAPRSVATDQPNRATRTNHFAMLFLILTVGGPVLIFLGIVGLALGLIWDRWSLKGRRNKRRQCIECGYDLRYVRHDRCPECGRPSK